MQSNWIITTIPDDRPIADIANDLAAAGLTVASVLADIGCITGSADAGVLEHLRAVRGVTDVAPDIALDLGPPDAPTTY